MFVILLQERLDQVQHFLHVDTLAHKNQICHVTPDSNKKIGATQHEIAHVEVHTYMYLFHTPGPSLDKFDQCTQTNWMKK